MNKDELQEARTNPDFLNHLEQRRVEAFEKEDIVTLYEVMDSMLVLDLDENKVDEIYEKILEITFEKLDSLIQTNGTFDINSDEIYYVRSLYENSIEVWSAQDFDKAQMLLVLLIDIVDDEKLKDAFAVNLIACARNIDLESFYENCVLQDHIEKDEKYGYFITDFKFDIDTYIDDNKELIEEVLEKLQVTKSKEE